MAYADVPTLKAYMGGFRDASSEDDALLADILNRVTAAIDRYCLRTFAASADTTRYYDATTDVGHGSAEERRTLHLDADLCQITSITNGDGTVLDPGDYITLPVNYAPWYAIRLKINSSIAWTYTDTPEGAIAVTGRFAYSVTPPDDVVHWTLRLAAWTYKQVDNYDASVDRPMVSPDGVLRLPMAWPQDVLAGLKPFKRL